MSGGNPFQRGLLAALILLLGLGLGISARASGAEVPPLSIGIATANIAREEPAKVAATFNAIQTAGFGIVRIGLKEPLPRSYAALVAAKEAGLKIYKTISMSVQENIDAFAEGKLALLENIHSGFHNHGGK